MSLSPHPEGVRARNRIDNMDFDRRDWDVRVDQRFRKEASRRPQQKVALKQQCQTEQQNRRR
jgi:hypothetical protein